MSAAVDEPPALHDQTSRIGAWATLASAVMLLLFAVVIGRVVQLKLAPDPRLEAAAGMTQSTRTEMARRGDLLDARGRVIAASSIVYRCFVDPQVVQDKNTIAVDLANLLNIDPVPIDEAILSRPNSRYVVVADPLEDWQVAALEDAKLRGVGLEPRLERHYPHGELGSRVVGLVGFEHTGLAGFEDEFNNRLTQTSGQLVYYRDAQRRPLWINIDGYRPSKDGSNVQISIDMVIQEIADRNLHEAVMEYNAGGGRAVVLDCNTGEILAMCDEIHHRPGWTQEINDNLRNVNPALGRNRCVTDPYEPGSTFKPFIWAVATELGRADPDEMLDLPESTGWRTPYGRLIRDSHYYGRIDWRTVLVKSCNTGMAMVAERMTHQEMRDAIFRFGFGSKTNCGLPGESIGIITSAREWRNYTQSSVSMGHEIAVTPVQMVRAFSAFATDGKLPALTIAAVDDDNVEVIQQVLKPETVKIVRDVMHDVMTEGTGRKAVSEKYEIFGKSGTAQLPNKASGGYFENRYVSSFIGGAPYENPRLVVLVVIDDPDRKIDHWGGAIAGPVVRDIIDETLTYLGVPPDKSPSSETANPTTIAAAE